MPAEGLMKGSKLEKKLRYVVYLLPLLALHLTAQASYSANNSYDGEALYNNYCAACHNTGTGGAQPIVGQALRGDDVNITKNAITTNKSRAGVTTNMSAYSFLSNAQLQAITNYTYPASSKMAVPSGAHVYTATAPAETPVFNANPSAANPIGVGSSSNFNLQAGLPMFSGPVDVYVGIDLGAAGFYLIDSLGQTTKNLVPWETSSTGDTNESFWGNIPMATIKAYFPAGTIIPLYLAVTPAGDASFKNYNLWATIYTVK